MGRPVCDTPALFLLSPPSDDRVQALLRERADEPFTYDAVGATELELDVPPRGFRLDRYGTTVGTGAVVFDRCVDALQSFANYPPSFTWVVPGPAAIAPGALFGTVVSHLGFASVHPCRIIYVIREPHRFGFGFGTLPGHAESGEERFQIRRVGDEVRYEVQAFSRPVGVLPRLGAPVTRAFQLRFQRETLEVMRAHASP